MAGNSIIGALRVVLGADTAALETGLKSAQSTLSKFSLGAAAGFAAVGVAVGAAAAAIGSHVKTSIDTADKMGKVAQSAGMPVEEFSKLAYAASLSDVEIDALGTSLGKLAKAMSATAGGAGGPASEAFQALGISVTAANGKLKSSGDVLTEVAGKFKNYEDGAAKTALAIAIFGKAGAAMIPLLNQGADGISKATAEAERYGVVISKDMAAAAEEFNDNLKRMSAISQGMWNQITSNALPAFMELSKIMLDSKEKSSLLGVTITVLTTALKGLVTAGILVNAQFKMVAAVLSQTFSAIALVAQGKFAEAWAALKTGTAEGKDYMAGAMESVKNIWLETGEKIGASSVETGKKMSAPIIEAANKAKNALQSFLDSTAKRTAGLDAEAQTIGKSVFEQDRLKVSLEALTIAKNNNITITDALRTKIDAAATAFATMSEKVQFGKQLFEQTRTPVEQFGITMENLNGAMQRGAINADTYARGVAQAQDRLVQANPYAQALGNSLTTAFDKAIQGGSKFSDILKGLLQDLGRAMANQAFRSMLYGNAGQGGASGGILGSIFGGLKFANGGSFEVPGAGGIDSKMVTMMATPGERVSVTKDGGYPGGSGGGMVYYDNRQFHDVTPDIMAKIDARIRATVPVIKQQVMRDLPKQRAMNPNFYSPG